MGSILDKLRRRRRASTPEMAKAKVEAAEKSKEHELDFDYEETTDILNATLDSVKRRADEQREKTRKTIDTLKSISFRPPEEGPSEQAG